MAPLALPLHLVAQSDGGGPIKTTICDLEKAPEKFNRKFVQMRAKVFVGFEASLLIDDQGCRIWLAWPHENSTALGSRKGTDYALMQDLSDIKRLERQDWKPIEEPPPVHPTKDHNYKVLTECLNQEYKGRRGHLCISCPLCAATVTVVGRFDHADRRLKATRKPNGQISIGGGGFGHLGAWDSQLVAESFSDVTTEPIDRTVYERISIAGTVVDKLRSAIANTSVTVRKQGSTSILKEVRTDADGVFTLQGLEAGRYELTIVAEGFRPKTLRLNRGPSAAVILKPIKLRNQ